MLLLSHCIGSAIIDRWSICKWMKVIVNSKNENTSHLLLLEKDVLQSIYLVLLCTKYLIQQFKILFPIFLERH